MRAVLKTWEASFNLKEMNRFLEMMSTIITILKNFMQKKGEEYLTLMKLAEVLIAIFEITILMIVFAMWWFLFYTRMSKYINTNRRLLSLFDISLVMENSYILSYLN